MPHFFGLSLTSRAKIAAGGSESEMGFASASTSVYEALLQQDSEGGNHVAGETATATTTTTTTTGRRRDGGPAYPALSSQHNLHRVWLAAADARRPSWSGERPATRKLVKDHPNGSARPSFMQELASDDQSDRDGWLQRQPRQRQPKRPSGSSGNRESRESREADLMAADAAGAGASDGIRRTVARWKDIRWGVMVGTTQDERAPVTRQKLQRLHR